MINITETAKTYLTNSAVKNDKPYVAFSVKGGGCAGFQYDWSFADEISDEYHEFELNENKKLLVDKTAELFILGSTIDYVEELGGSYISIKNPNSTSSCGCGESFGA